MNIAEKARLVASAAHSAANHFRKITNDPYIIHPEAVVDLSMFYLAHNREVCVNKYEVAAIAWLHDTVEDTGLKLDFLFQEFGEFVADGVDCLSAEPMRDRAAKNEAYIQKLNSAKSPAYYIVKLADIRANFDDIVISHKNPEPEKQFKKYRRFIEEKSAMINAVPGIKSLKGADEILRDMQDFLMMKDAA